MRNKCCTWFQLSLNYATDVIQGTNNASLANAIYKMIFFSTFLELSLERFFFIFYEVQNAIWNP